jgi:hypothetical protein
MLMAIWVRYLIQTVVTGAVLWPRQRATLHGRREPAQSSVVAIAAADER